MSNKTPIFKFAIREDLNDANNVNFLPTRATPRSTGWDVYAAQKDRKPIVIDAGVLVKIPLGFRTFCPENWWFELRPRSSSFAKKNLHCLYGVIDEDYEGETILAAQYIPSLTFESYTPVNLGPFSFPTVKHQLTIEFGESIGQIIPIKRKDMIVQSITNDECDELYSNRKANRGAGGFGSTSENK